MGNTPTNYFKNTKTSRERTLRIEVIGEVSEAERHFLDGISFFAAGTMSKDDEKHTTFVSSMMIKLIRYILTEGKKKEK